MDDRKLEDILNNQSIPDADVNAKKRAVNLAMSTFAQEQKKNKNNSQGFSFLRSLIGISNDRTRNEMMEQNTKKKFVYGGMATAMAVVLVASLSVSQLDQALERFDIQAPEESVVKADLHVVDQKIIESVTLDPTRVTVQEYAASLDEIEQEEGAIISEAIGGQKKRQAKFKEERFEQVAKDDMISAPAPSEKLVKKSSRTFAAEQKKIAAPQSIPLAQAPLAKAMSDKSLIISSDIMPQPPYQEVGRDKFEDFKENMFKLTSEEPVSTFSSDVDTASYSFMRKQLNSGVLPQKNAVRVEELINYFDYSYDVPENQTEPFKPTIRITNSPWAEGKQLMRVGIKGYEIIGEKPRSNLVFLLDVSGSMNAPDKLPLLKNSLKLLLDTLGPEDTVAIAVYAGAAGTVLEPTKVSEKHKIVAALDRLNAGGSTAGAAGIRLAYDLAQENFDEDAVNRVILATDGDFNVGITNQEELKDFVERKRESGVFLSVFGFGQGNYNDHVMQTLAQNGNGVAAYIDSLSEARKVLVEEASSSLFTIAKDVKFQIEFNPTVVSEYRLIGYETRHLNREDFNNDKVDAGDIGAGHSVTALYEFTPAGVATSVDALRYGSSALAEKKYNNDDLYNSVPSDQEYAFVKIRYKLPNEKVSKLITTPVTHENRYDHCPEGLRCEPVSLSVDDAFATAVAAFGQILKGGQYTGTYSYDDVIALAQRGKGSDEFGYRAEFIQLVRLTKSARVQ